jgi:hypothetical protein
MTHDVLQAMWVCVTRIRPVTRTAAAAGAMTAWP